MEKDPFYKKIIEGLNTRLDPELFEQCATDILRKIYPSLVPIRGGQDSGMDGAIADLEGEPFPLISTTSKNVIGNLTKNLKSHTQSGKLQRKAVLATSVLLSQRKRTNLNTQAKELGYTLIQIHDQASFASLLYRDSRWCKELLKLYGDPSPLSIIPHRSRPALNITMVGREEELKWLKESSGDRLIVGQPGCGKTFLLYKLAYDGLGLFIVGSDENKIADAIRDENQKTLFIDDAQLHLDLLNFLKHFRQTSGINFSIIGSCWSGNQSEIQSILNLPEVNVHNLDLFSRDEIVSVIKNVGLIGPDVLLNEITNQAEGRAGLAATLAHLCLQGNINKVIFGETLLECLLVNVDQNDKHKIKALIATLSLGGNVGFSLQRASEFLGMKNFESQWIVTDLQIGGIIHERNNNLISVRPPTLRHILVKDIFCCGAKALALNDIIGTVSDLGELTNTLIGAKARGGIMDEEMLFSFVVHLDQNKIWSEYASLGKKESERILNNYPNKIITIARQALVHCPETAIPFLLKSSIADYRALHSHTEHPLRLLSDWVQAGIPGTGQAIQRREILLHCIQHWLGSDNDEETGLRALKFVFSPNFEDHLTDPGLGNTITMRHGCITLEEMRSLKQLWNETIVWLKKQKISKFHLLKEMVEIWAKPQFIIGKISVEQEKEIRSIASKLFNDIYRIGKHAKGFTFWANRLSGQLDINLKINIDRTFAILYPKRDNNDWGEAEEKELKHVIQLAKSLTRKNPKDVIEKLLKIEDEVIYAGIPWPRYTAHLYHELASKVPSSILWLQALIKLKASSEFITPFLQRCSNENEVGWIKLANQCLKDEEQKHAVVTVLITHCNPPKLLLNKVLSIISDYCKFIESQCSINQISDQTLKRLLCHSSRDIRNAVVEGLSMSRKSKIPNVLRLDWEKCVLNDLENDYILKNILQRDPSLAEKWLKNKLTQKNFHFYKYRHTINSIFTILNLESKKKILKSLKKTVDLYEIIVNLIGNDIYLYEYFLSIKKLHPFHLYPLAGKIDTSWIDKAKLALDVGYSPENIAYAVLHPQDVAAWFGGDANRWIGWIEPFEKLSRNDNPLIKKVGEFGFNYVQEHYNKAKKKDRLEEIYGYEY